MYIQAQLSIELEYNIFWWLRLYATHISTCLGAKLLDYRDREDLDDSIPIHLDDVECSGNEVRLIDCSSSKHHSCFHWEDVAVRCNRDGWLHNTYWCIDFANI